MESRIRILYLEDNPKDFELIRACLESEGIPCELVRVETQADFVAALGAGRFELVLSDYSVLGFDGMSALATLKQKLPEVPFILVTGTLGEEQAVESLKAGVSDFVLKGNLTRLAPAIRRALKDTEDRAQRQQAEQDLRESEEKFRNLAENANDGILIATGQGTHLYANERAAEITGYSIAELLTITMKDLAHPDEVKELAERLRKRIAGEPVKDQYETAIIRKDGETVPIEVSGATTVWLGQLASLVMIRDLTERKRAEEALRQSEERYRAVMEQSADGIFLLDGDTKRIVEANRAFAQMLGYTLEEMPGLSMYDFNVADREEMNRRFQSLLRGEAPVLIERQYRRKDGSLLPVWLSANLIFFGEKKVVSTLVRDLTEKKALEAQFLRAQRMESIGLLAGGIAHDLNNLLTPILINAEILGPTLLQPTSQKMLSSIASNAQRGADIVKQILTFARGMEEEFLVVSPKHLLKEMEGFLRETFPKSISIETEIGKDLWPLSGEATQLHQVLMNLCLNARDAMPKGGTLSLSARNVTFDSSYAAMHPDAKIGPYLLFSVEDTGAGIAPEHLQQVFDPFFTTKERDQGTGLGLATASAIVKGHGGFLQVSSQVGKGTQFSVYLPASPSAEMAKAEEERAPLPTGKGELLLLVEDEASVREIIQVALEAYGYQVMAACDGTEAVSLYAQHPGEIQVVITDMAMPIMDGATTIRALAKIDPSVKVIAISGAEWEQKAAEASGLAFQAFLQKPFTAERLLRAVAEVLKG